jgi:hypothetical protein
VVNAQVLTGAVVTTNSKSVAYLKEMLVKHDFIRYISNNLFNTPYGTDLFSNETELITDLNNLGDITTGVLFQINAKLANATCLAEMWLSIPTQRATSCTPLTCSPTHQYFS